MFFTQDKTVTSNLLAYIRRLWAALCLSVEILTLLPQTNLVSISKKWYWLLLAKMAPLGQAFHEDKEISKYLVDCPVEHTSLTIAESKIANLGSGLVTNSIIEPGRQIFKSKPLLAVVDYRFDTICHYCLKGSEKVPLAEGPTEEPRPKVCSACRRVRFCSKVHPIGEFSWHAGMSPC